MPRHESKLPGWALRPATGVRPGAIVALLAAYCFFIIAAWIVFGRGYAALDLTVVKVAQKSRGTAWFRRYELVSVWRIRQWKRHSCLLSPRAFLHVSFLALAKFEFVGRCTHLGVARDCPVVEVLAAPFISSALRRRLQVGR